MCTHQALCKHPRDTIVCHLPINTSGYLPCACHRVTLTFLRPSVVLSVAMHLHPTWALQSSCAGNFKGMLMQAGKDLTILLRNMIKLSEPTIHRANMHAISTARDISWPTCWVYSAQQQELVISEKTNSVHAYKTVSLDSTHVHTCKPQHLYNAYNQDVENTPATAPRRQPAAVL